MEMMNKRTDKIVAEIYRQRRSRSEDIAIERKEKYLSLYPELRQIEDKLSAENARIALSIISDGVAREGSPERDNINRERSEFLSRNRIPADYDSPVYTCVKCSDTGFDISDPEGRCSCYYDVIVPILFEYSGFPGISKYTFDSFNPELFSDNANEELNRSKNTPRKQILGIRDAAMRFADNIDAEHYPNMFFIGSPGTGKTFMAGCVVDKVVRKGRSVCYLSAPRMFDVISEYRTASAAFSPDKERLERASEAYSNLLNSDLLVIDDLGTETFNSNRQPELLAVVNHRTGCARKMIITTNLEMTDLMNFYDERLISRIYGAFSVYKFFGDDLRLRTRYNQITEI